MKPIDPNRVAKVCLLAAGCFAISAALADDPPQQREGYVDSVYSWGSWELGIAPAAGPQPPRLQALNYREAGIRFRPNDNADYFVQAEEVTASTPTTPPVTPSPTPTPVIDSTTIQAGQPTPTGGPLDGLF